MVDLNVERESRSLDIALLSLYFPARSLAVSGFDMVLMEPILINGNIVCYVIEALRPEDCKLFFISLSKFIMVTLMG